MSRPSTETRQSSQPPPQRLPSPTPARPDGPPAEDGSAADADAASTILRDLVLQAAQRAWQVQQRAQAEAQQALQARNAFD